MSFALKTFIDLFSGIGAFNQALSKNGLECVFASDIDERARHVYEDNYGLRPAGDITQIHEADIPAHDVLCAGFPCQPFSMAGHRRGLEDARGTLFFDIMRIAEYHRPKMLILENVRGLKNHDGGRTWSTMKGLLEDVGYFVFSKVIDASHHWSAQKRERVIIVAVRWDMNVRDFAWPMKAMYNWTVGDLIDEDVERPMSQVFVHERDSDGRRDVVQRAGRFGKGGQGYRIYHTDGLGVTLCSGGGGAGACTGIYLVNGKPRILTADECQRMTGFPESFRRHRHEKTAVRQFGNSIPVGMLSSIARVAIYQVERGMYLKSISA